MKVHKCMCGCTEETTVWRCFLPSASFVTILVRWINRSYIIIAFALIFKVSRNPQIVASSFPVPAGRPCICNWLVDYCAILPRLTHPVHQVLLTLQACSTTVISFIAMAVCVWLSCPACGQLECDCDDCDPAGCCLSKASSSSSHCSHCCPFKEAPSLQGPPANADLPGCTGTVQVGCWACKQAGGLSAPSVCCMWVSTCLFVYVCACVCE